jgi:uncharacterized protein YacL
LEKNLKDHLLFSFFNCFFYKKIQPKKQLQLGENLKKIIHNLFLITTLFLLLIFILSVYIYFEFESYLTFIFFEILTIILVVVNYILFEKKFKKIKNEFIELIKKENSIFLNTENNKKYFNKGIQLQFYINIFRNISIEILFSQKNLNEENHLIIINF